MSYFSTYFASYFAGYFGQYTSGSVAGYIRVFGPKKIERRLAKVKKQVAVLQKSTVRNYDYEKRIAELKAEIERLESILQEAQRRRAEMRRMEEDYLLLLLY